MGALTSTCRCGHVQAAHEHFRRGSDCGQCGRSLCQKFVAAEILPVLMPERELVQVARTS